MHQDGGLHVPRDGLVARLVGDLHDGAAAIDVQGLPVLVEAVGLLPVNLKALDHGAGNLEGEGGSERDRLDELRPEDHLADVVLRVTDCGQQLRVELGVQVG